MAKTKLIFSVDVILILTATLLILIGILFIYSSGLTSDGTQTSTEYIRQIVWAILGFVLLFLVTLVKTDWLHDLSVYLFLFSLILIAFTVRFGRVVNGARSWIGIGELGIQPSEFAKIAFVLAFAKWLETHETTVQTVQGLLPPFFLFLVPPVGLILLQPDLGTALVFMPTFIVMLFFAGAQPRHLGYITLSGLLVGVFSALPIWAERIAQIDIPILSIFTEVTPMILFGSLIGVLALLSIIGLITLKRPIFYWLMYFFSLIGISFGGSFLLRRVIREYQIMRLIVFLDPEIDRLGSGWHIIQSTIAVGSGGLQGKGFLQGTQSQLQYLPEQSTDFIFSILSEELGFIGAIVLFALYAILLYRIIRVAYQAKEGFSTYTAIGISSIFFFHFVINIGMTIGLMPITGIPLLLVSYGGSHLWASLVALGIVLNLGLNKYRY
ncbi:MAG: rod shape-determining protein RodA [Spirochaetales bacterium]|nr:rod shape-determining protein RodA [Spirochaetales bacterium]